MKPEVSFPISGAERTVLRACIYGCTEGAGLSYKNSNSPRSGVDLPGFLKQSLANATDKKVKAEFVRR